MYIWKELQSGKAINGDVSKGIDMRIIIKIAQNTEVEEARENVAKG